MCETVHTMANNQIIELECTSSLGKKSANFKPGLNLVTERDARAALRICKGNIWQAVEKCIQRYQDTKRGFGTPFSGSSSQLNSPTTKHFPGGAIPKSSKSFSMKVSGFGTGKANNDAYVEDGDGDQEYGFDDARSDVAEEEVENLMNPEFIFKEAPNQTPMDAFLSSKENNETNELLDFYMRKLQQTDSMHGEQIKFDQSQMEALIYNWRFEKMVLDQEREQMKRVEKERRKMQKMLDLQRRIGGYMSDGTTTEEELDREVEQVFASHDELRAKLASIDADDYSSDTTTEAGDVYKLALPGTSGGIADSSSVTSVTSSSAKTLQEDDDRDEEEEVDQFDEV